MGARVIENWADVTGQVLETRPGQSEKFVEVNLQIEAAVDVEGMTNLVAPLVGKTMWVNMPCDLAESLDVEVGVVVQARVRRLTADLAYVHNDYVTVHRLRMAAPPPTVGDAHDGEATLAATENNYESSSTPTYAESSQSSTHDQEKDSVPTVLVEKGFRFYFYMADLINEPPHVHIDKDGKTAKFWLSPLRVSDAGRFSGKETRQIERILSENMDALMAKWNSERAKLR
ncbi:MAG: DUF4160 domain-containing protein [Caldilineaceae bacterium]